MVLVGEAGGSWEWNNSAQCYGWLINDKECARGG